MSSARWGPGAARQQPAGFVEPSLQEDDNYDGDFAFGDSDYTWLDAGVVTFITLKIDAGA